MIDLVMTFNEVMYHSILIVNKYGYCNQNQALIDETIPTSKRVIESLSLNPIDVKSTEYETIGYIVKWLKDSDESGGGNYMVNARKILTNDVQSLSEIGLIASVLVPYMEYCKAHK